MPETSHNHIFDPKNIEILESKERKLWQNPDKILEQLDLKASQTVADLGCGSGYFSVPISKKVKKVYAIDLQKEMLEHLEKKLLNQGIKNIITVLSSDGSKIPLPEQTIDTLLTVNTLHEFQNLDSMAEEIRRVIKQKGHAVIVDFKKAESDFGPPLAIRIPKQDAMALFENHGFETANTLELQHHYVLVFQRK